MMGFEHAWCRTMFRRGFFDNLVFVKRNWEELHPINRRDPNSLEWCGRLAHSLEYRYGKLNLDTWAGQAEYCMNIGIFIPNDNLTKEKSISYRHMVGEYVTMFTETYSLQSVDDEFANLSILQLSRLVSTSELISIVDFVEEVTVEYCSKPRDVRWSSDIYYRMHQYITSELQQYLVTSATATYNRVVDKRLALFSQLDQTVDADIRRHDQSKSALRDRVVGNFPSSVAHSIDLCAEAASMELIAAGGALSLPDANRSLYRIKMRDNIKNRLVENTKKQYQSAD